MKTNWNADRADDADIRGSNYPGYTKKESPNVVSRNDLIILEIKAAEGLREENKAQLINYLKATNKEIGLLLNFGKKPDFKRAIFSNERKEISEIESSNPRVSAQSASSAFHSSG
ncbi:MAG: GxxExxY protein [Candidatus Methanoperedens sp.]|nr:GxxExxY protein [Candidatus Methanoperedens sp.]